MNKDILENTAKKIDMIENNIYTEELMQVKKRIYKRLMIELDGAKNRSKYKKWRKEIEFKNMMWK